MRRPTKLKDAFLTYNVLYFSGQLATDTIVVWSHGLGRNCCGTCDPDLIRINAALKRFEPVWRTTLLHEMAHLTTQDERAEHGKRWKREMRRLMRLGAFDGLL